MSKVYIFDVDGTLTPSRLPMTKEFQKFFKEWVKKNKFYLVTGSNIEKLQEQMCMYDIEAQGLFTCCGNEMWIPDPHIVNISAYPVYENKFEPPDDLITYLEHQLEIAQFFARCGNHIEKRNFIRWYRNANHEEINKVNGEGKIILEKLLAEYTDEIEMINKAKYQINLYPSQI